MVADVFMQDEIIYKDDTHQYFNRQDVEYTSVTRLLKSIKVPFDRDGISRRMAAGIAKTTGVSVEQAQKDLLNEWNVKKDSSVDKGNYVHNGLEDYTRSGVIAKGLEEPVAYMQSIFKDYYRFFPEVLLFSHPYRVAGRTDIVLQRQKSANPVFDFIDYKTNESKGIQYDSISRKEGENKHINKFFLYPFDYLEYCNYVEYSLQLSLYAYMAMRQLGLRIGKLGIIYFDNQFKPIYIPVPFMASEAAELLKLNISREFLPTALVESDPIKVEMMERAKYPMTVKECFEIKDDWD